MNDSFVFHFDQDLPPVLFGRAFPLTGWLIHREGKPIHGLRVVIRRGFRRWNKAAQRRRRRPEVAAAFPDLPDAGTSGFLFEVRYRLGRTHLTFQVLDHESRWQTFHTATVTCYPLAVLRPLPRTRQLLISRLRECSGNPQQSSRPATPIHLASQTQMPRRIDLFATSKSNLFILEIGELLAAGFRDAGREAVLHLDTLPSSHPSRDTLQIVVTPHEFYNLFLADKLSAEQMTELTRHVHLLGTEQPETHWFEANVHWAHHSLGMADINPLGVTAYRARGFHALQLPLGFHPLLQHGQPDRPHSARRHDLTFLGSVTPRREIFFAKHADFFAQHSCHVRFVPLGFAKTAHTRSYLSPERRNALLGDSRIFLNLHYSEQRYFEWHRMLLGLANGCCIISETGVGYGQLIPGRHFIMVEPEDLLDACAYYVAHPAEAEKVARAGQEFVCTHLTQAQMCATYLTALLGGENSLIASHIHPDRAPESPEDGSSHAHVHRKHGSWHAALKQDLQRVFRRPEAAVKEEPVEVPEVECERLREAVKVKRAEYHDRFDQQQRLLTNDGQAWQIHENEASRRCAAPSLTVLITLYNYAQHIDECLASISAAAIRLASAPEILIVNDASTDESLARAMRLQSASELPVRIVDKKFNTGLADARNVGTRLARAPYVFMMDADNLLFPRALEQLRDAITSSNAAAAYSMLCRFRGNPSNRVGLLSHFDFDPQILVQGPYIDAMAMFRRDVLLETGGYDNNLNQIAWFGWEDYDLWLRLAQRGYEIAFVPNTLCLYRHHTQSMINTTNLFERELVDCFIERYGGLLDRFEPRATIFGVERSNVARAR